MKMLSFLLGDNMIFYNGKIIKTDINELDKREQLLLLKGIYQEIINDNLERWTQMIDAGKYKTPECDRLWHETCRYLDVIVACDNALKKLSEQ